MKNSILTLAIVLAIATPSAFSETCRGNYTGNYCGYSSDFESFMSMVNNHDITGKEMMLKKGACKPWDGEKVAIDRNYLGDIGKIRVRITETDTWVYTLRKWVATCVK